MLRHIDAALYDIHPPLVSQFRSGEEARGTDRCGTNQVTTLLGIKNPKGPNQTILYDDGTGEELEATPGATACMSSRNQSRGSRYGLVSAISCFWRSCFAGLAGRLA